MKPKNRAERNDVWLFVLVVLLLTQACGYFPAFPQRTRAKPRAGFDPAGYDRIETICRKLVEEGHTPGLVLLIGRGDQVLFRKAFGHRMTEPTTEPMTIDTLFDLASLTKPIATAPAIMLLVQDGRLALDASVGRYVPEFDNSDKKEMTILHLLNHTSGLPAYTSAATVEKECGPRPNPDGLIRHIAGLPKKYPIGHGHVYSCLNYLVLARVAQNATGQNMDTFLRERLWRPLGMKDTTFYPTSEQIARTAPTIYRDGRLRRGEVHDPLAYYSICPSYAPGNAGCFSTADDLAKYVRMLLDGGRSRRTRFFQPAIWEKITTDQTGTLAANRTCGWGVATGAPYSTPRNATSETCCLIHTGYTGTLIWMDKLSKAYVIFLSNCVYPTDVPKRREAVTEARRQVVRTVLEHLDLYQEKGDLDRAPAGRTDRYFKIRVVDEQTGRGVPLVELRTVNNIRYYTDSNGIVAFYEPGLMNQKVFFFVQSHGYVFPKDGFGFAGRILDVKEGGSAEIKIKRVNTAERLYRITGEGIYNDSVLIGEPAPTKRPLLSGQVVGQDSTMAVPWKGKIYWFWGDTSRPRYPLGQFQMSGATSLPPGRGGLDPSLGINLDYFVDSEGFSRRMCPTTATGLMWLDGMMVVRNGANGETMVAHYARMKSLGEMLEHGIAVWDENEEIFKKHVEFDLNDKWRCARGHPIRVTENGVDYFVFPTPYATVRVKADLEAISRQSRYEAFTCIVAGSRHDKATADVERGPDGQLAYAWKADTDPIDGARERELIAAGKIKPEEARYQLKDVDTQQPVELHSGSIRWNEYRKKWIMIAVQIFGKPSFLGEVWFAEADSVTGPWWWAKRIVTHDKYTFYNPVHHPFFDQDGGRLVYFEGTYANTFSGNPDQTPRYDYNQIMYRLDLSDPRLSPEVLRPKGER